MVSSTNNEIPFCDTFGLLYISETAYHLPLP